MQFANITDVKLVVLGKPSTAWENVRHPFKCTMYF